MDKNIEESLNAATSNLYMAADATALRKEKAIERALNDYFGDNWSEEGIKQTDLVQFNVTPDGEYLEIAGENKVFFGKIEEDVQIDGKSVICRYKQEIRRLY